MKKYKKTIKTVTQEVKTLECIECDICKKQFESNDNLNCDPDWINEDYAHITTSASITSGVSYPDDWYYTKTFFEICPDCFQKEIIDHLKEKFNIAPQIEEI